MIAGRPTPTLIDPERDPSALSSPQSAPLQVQSPSAVFRRFQQGRPDTSVRKLRRPRPALGSIRRSSPNPPRRSDDVAAASGMCSTVGRRVVGFFWIGIGVRVCKGRNYAE